MGTRIKGCLSDSEATARTAQVPWKIAVVLFKEHRKYAARGPSRPLFTWWKQRNMQVLTKVYHSTVLCRYIKKYQKQLMPLSDVLPHWSIIAKEKLGTWNRLKSVLNLVTLQYMLPYICDMVSCLPSFRAFTMHCPWMWTLEVEIVAKPWCNDKVPE